MAQVQGISFDFQSDALDELTLDLSVPASARGRFLRNPQRYIREFLQERGQAVGEVSLAVGEESASLAECLAEIAIGTRKPKSVHLKTGEHKCRYVVL